MHTPIPHANWRVRFTAAAIVAWLFLLAAPGIAAQAEPSGPPQVIFTIHYTGDHRPIEVTRVLLDGKPIPLDVAIPVPDQWLNRLAIDLRNISTRDIVFGQVIINFPETGTGSHEQPIFSTGASVGRRPLTYYRRKDDGSVQTPANYLRRPEVDIVPGQIIQFSFIGDTFSQGQAENLAGRAVRQVQIMPYDFSFADGSRWASGEFLAPEPPPVMWKAVDPSGYLKHPE